MSKYFTRSINIFEKNCIIIFNLILEFRYLKSHVKKMTNISDFNEFFPDSQAIKIK